VIHKQEGIFIVELSMVLVVFSLLLVFSIDIISKLSIQGKLDRTSYSVVSILAERRQLFNGDDTLCSKADRGCHKRVEHMYRIAKYSMARMFTDFDAKKVTVVIEQQKFQNNKPSDYYVKWLPKKNPGCTFVPLNTSTELSPETRYNRRASLFQVTICYESDDLTTDIIGSGFTTLSSSSLALGRNG